MNKMEKKVVIVCEDIYGLDIYTMIRAINDKADRIDTVAYRVEGFISNTENPFGKVRPPVPVIGTINDWINSDEISLIMGIRDPERKERAVITLKEKGAVFETLVAPWTLLPSSYEAGEGCIIANYNLKHNSRFGNYVIMDTAMCETVEVGDYSTLCPFVNMTSATIGKGVFVGSHAVIMSHKTVGDGAYIYPGSVVVKNVKPGAVVAGVPASGANVKKWESDKKQV